jgi:hypothetical protein
MACGSSCGVRTVLSYCSSQPDAWSALHLMHRYMLHVFVQLSVSMWAADGSWTIKFRSDRCPCPDGLTQMQEHRAGSQLVVAEAA